MNALITDLAAAAELAPLVERLREILDPAPPFEVGKPSEQWLEPTETTAEQVQKRSDGCGPHKKLTMTGLKEASQKLPKEMHEFPAAHRGKDRDIER